MAQRTVVTLIDDLTGTEAEETVAFALDGQGYQIDLSAPNAKRLRAVLAEYADAARKTGRIAVAPGARKRTAPSRARSADVRAWAAENGVPCASHGRIPVAALAAYDAAHSGPSAVAAVPEPGPAPAAEPVADSGGQAAPAAARAGRGRRGAPAAKFTGTQDS